MSEVPELDFIPALTSLPLNKMLPLVNTLLQNVTQRQLGGACFDHGIKAEFEFVKIEESQQ